MRKVFHGWNLPPFHTVEIGPKMGRYLVDERGNRRGAALSHQFDPAVGEISDVTRDRIPSGDVSGRVTKPDPLDSAGEENLLGLPTAGIYRVGGHACEFRRIASGQAVRSNCAAPNSWEPCVAFLRIYVDHRIK
jgi:hypothetical protein